MTQKANKSLRGVQTYVVPQRILKNSALLLRSLSSGVRESAILWTGTCLNTEARVRRIVVPRQTSNAVRFDVSLEERLKIASQLNRSGEMLLAQLHTHPKEAFHSAIDDQLALPRHTGAISIVIPDFAMYWEGDLNQVSVNRHLGKGVWQELGSDVVCELFEILQ